MLTVSVAGVAGQADGALLAWAAANGRVLLTHDLNTMIAVALDRATMGQPMPGIVAVPQQMSIGAAISDLALIASCRGRKLQAKCGIYRFITRYRIEVILFRQSVWK